MSKWDAVLERETERALARIRIADPDLETAYIRERQANAVYTDSVVEGYFGDPAVFTNGSLTLVKCAERNAWRRYILEKGGEDQWT